MASIDARPRRGKTPSIQNADNERRSGAIVSWQNVKNKAEYSTHEEGSIEVAVMCSVARLVQRGLDLRQWRCQSISTPQGIYAEVTRGRIRSGDHRLRFEGKMALTILRDAGKRS